MYRKKETEKRDSLVLPLFPVGTEINEASCQHSDRSGDGKAEILAPCSKSLPVLVSSGV